MSAHALVVRLGSAPGVSFSLRHAGELADATREGRGQVVGRLDDWRRVAVMIRTGEDARLVVLEPGDDEATLEATLEVRGFYVRGRFRVVQKVNHAGRAREAFRAFVPA